MTSNLDLDELVFAVWIVVTMTTIMPLFGLHNHHCVDDSGG